MHALICTVAIVVCFVATATPAADLAVDQQRDAMSLAGTWDMLLEHGDREVWKPEVASGLGPWQPVSVPGGGLLSQEGDRTSIRELHGKARHVWVRHEFQLDAGRASRDAVLRWGGIRFGAAAWINGRAVTEHAPVGPHTASIPRGTLRAGRNEIILRITAWGGVARSASGYPLTPTGAATTGWGSRNPGVYQPIWLEFYDDVYARWVLAVPDVSGKSVTFRLWLDAATGAAPGTAEFEATVRECGSGAPAAVKARRSADVSPGSPVEITCPIEQVKAWTPETPQLYEAELKVAVSGKPCDAVRFRFGMRNITTAEGRFRLNGKPLWLRGSNLVNEWLWGETYNRNVKQYIVDEARSMSLNCFRTHTQPPPAAWLDVADEHGTMILAEMPLLYNNRDFRYTPEELEVLHGNALLDATGWVTRMWNHPSVVIWVLSNESLHDNEWESGPLYEHVKSLDPTRLCMRSGDWKVGTPDILDIHTCWNVHSYAEGFLIEHATKVAAGKDPRRPLTNTEYMNLFSGESVRWLGRDKHPDFPLLFAEFGAEHTEAMRRLQFDCILPYMYAPWTRLRGRGLWREDYPTPMAAALQSTMAPVFASLELFDRNHVAGGSIETRLTFINETHDDVQATLSLCVTPSDPLLIPDSQALEAAVWRQETTLRLPADSVGRRSISVPVPATEGTYYLAAVLSRDGAKPVVSQRTVRAIDVSATASPAGRRVVLLGGDDEATQWLVAHKCRVVPGPVEGEVKGDVVLVWDAGKLPANERRAAAELRRFAETGGRIAVVDQKAWPWQDLAKCEIRRADGNTWKDKIVTSRAFAFEGVDHPMLANIRPEYLWRWNGLPGTILDGIVVPAPGLKPVRKLLWGGKPENTAALRLPLGKGEIVFCQLKVRGRVGRASPAYDPVAERVLSNLLGP